MKISMCFFYFLIHCFMASLAMAVTNITTDQSALLAFKAHVADPRGILTNNWSISYPICNWAGVSCDARHHRVVALNFSYMSLQGTVPPHLGNLSFLVSLEVRDNNFHGILPNELGQLRRLRFVNFYKNKLNGSLPSWIGNLYKLQILILRNNSFTGHIPNSLSNLTNLERLDLRYNMIDGDIPSRIGNLSKLTYLSIGDNNLQGEIPTEIGNIQNLNCLVLCGNKLNGPIPPTIFNISTMANLNLIDNQLSGHLPSMIGDSIQSLEYFEVSQNKLTGTIPNSITNASKLIILELSFNSFSGFIPNTFGNLRFLSVFNIASNNFTTEPSTAKWNFLSSLTNCRMLTALELASIPLRGILPPLIGNFSASLQYFYAYDCKLMGNIPQEIGNLSGLIVLSLSDNNLNGTIPTTVGRLQQLQGLVLYGNNLQGSIPSEICHMEGLNGLLLNENMLTGHIPQCFGSLTSLRTLGLGSNKLTSTIPQSFWSLEYILSIDLSSNYLSGSLSSSIQNLKVLIDLDLSRNQLSGDIPITIGSLIDLVNLFLASNRFQGPIPKSLGGLKSLESLDLSDNSLSGEIPKSLETLSHLKQFNVSHNKLEREIPTKGPFRYFSAESFIWNYALCGPPRLLVPPCKEDDNGGSKKGALLVLKIVLPITISAILAVFVIIVYIRCRYRRAKNPGKEDLLPLASWRRISYLDIQRATDGFSECNLLGRGSFGSVYKGSLSDGTNIAIKVFNMQLESAFKSFNSECEILRNIRHRNLVKILSSCCNIDFKALVLDFMSNGNLEKWLYSHNYFLNIRERLNIMIDVGLALEYLHHSLSPPVVHCDLKPSNILLNESMVGHVCDFGISKLLGEEDDYVTRTITMASIGYMAPEYGSEGIVSSKCDVYSYGILLMETFTRKKPTDEMFTGNVNLKKWVNESLPHGLTEIVDANLLREEQDFSAKMDCLSSIMNLALACCMESPEQRTNMTDATAELRKIKVKFVDNVTATE